VAPAAYGLSQVDEMLARERPDTVIVTSVDATHDEHVCRALLAGCDVTVEKADGDHGGQVPTHPPGGSPERAGARSICRRPRDVWA
jgi:hypothetical protein